MSLLLDAFFLLPNFPFELRIFIVRASKSVFLFVYLIPFVTVFIFDVFFTWMWIYSGKTSKMFGMPFSPRLASFRSIFRKNPSKCKSIRLLEVIVSLYEKFFIIEN